LIPETTSIYHDILTSLLSIYHDYILLLPSTTSGKNVYVVGFLDYAIAIWK